MEQMIINALGAILLLLIGFLLNTINESILKLQKELNSLAILIAGNYLKREEHDKDIDLLWAEIRRLNRECNGK